MKRELAGRRILITGASSGIGRALAEETARQGMRLVIAARSREPLDALVAEWTARGAEVMAVAADVTSSADRQRLLQATVERFGGLDVLVNNAGVGSQGPFPASTESVLRQVMEVNFFAPVELIRAALPLLQGGRQPAVVNVTSMCGRRAIPMWAEYSASKFALLGLSESLRTELASQGIDVLTIVPGLTRTNLDRTLLRRDQRMYADFEKGMAPSAVARAILDALRRNRPETVVGWEARLILGLNRLWPRFVDFMFRRFVRRQYGPGPR